MYGLHKGPTLALLTMLTGCTPAGDKSWNEAVGWTRNRAMPLATTEPGQGFDDLRQLTSSIGSARIVAMGEATHGTREFFQLKHRIFEYLVEEHDFRLFGLEASYAGCLPIDHYIQTGEGDVRALIKGQGFWVWDTEEVLELVEWMRAYNVQHSTPEDRLYFYGFDTQDAATPLQVALDALRTFEPDEAKRLEQSLEPATANRYPGVLGDGSMEDYEVVIRAIDDLQEGLSRHREALEDTELGYARIHFTAEAGRYALMASRPAEGSPRRNFRDETMAEVVTWILDHHGDKSRIMLWAHDGHVTKYQYNLDDPPRKWSMMGTVLEDRFGDNYLPIGFSFAEGEFQALYWPKAGEDWARRVLGVYRIDSVITGSIDHLFSEVGESQFLIDLRTDSVELIPEWFKQPRSHRSIGGLFDENDPNGPRFIDEIVLSEHFELMAFVHTTSRARPLSPPPTFVLGAWTKDSDDGGAFVTGVAQESIAEVAGLRANDVIIELDSLTIENTYDLSVALSQLNSPGEVMLRILRPIGSGHKNSRTLYIKVPAWVGENHQSRPR